MTGFVYDPLDGPRPRYVPDHITAKAGTVVFFLENLPVADYPTVVHNMQIGPAIGQVRAASTDVQANAGVTFSVNDLTPGTYVFWCSIVGNSGRTHGSNGMVGTLTITT